MALGAPIEGHTWVLRSVAWTFGAFLAFIGGAIQVGDDEPGLWLCQTQTGQYIGVHKFTIVWEGRIVVPELTTLYAYASGSDAGDISVSGYDLTN